MPADVVIVGGGVGGTLTANLLARKLPQGAARIRLVDATGLHVYQPGFLYVALNQANGGHLARDVRSLLRPEVELLIDRAVRVDPATRTVELEWAGPIPYDHLVLGTGSHLDYDAVPGLRKAAHGFYSLTDAERLREALRNFEGGTIVTGVAGLPYKCPPAPIEFTLMLAQELRRRGLRERTTVRYLSPMPRAFPIEAASKVMEEMFERAGVRLETFCNVERVDGEAQQIHTLEGEVFDYDLAVLIPPHVGAQVVKDSGLGDRGGWLPVDRHTLRVDGAPDVYGIGDATNLPISKSGSTGHFEAPVIAEQIAASLEGRAPSPTKGRYQGQVMCFFETGDGRASILRFDYDHPPKPPKPTRYWHFGKWLFNRAYWVTVPQGRF